MAILIILINTNSALAYIDPASGSVVMNLIIGLFVAIGVMIKTFWYKIKNILGLSKNNQSKADKNNSSD